jgi:GTPase SAR1 family protein
MLQIHPSQNSRELVISAPTLISTTVEVPATMQTHPRISAPTLISATWGWPDQIPILSLHSDQGDQQLTSAPHLSPVQRHENKEEEQAAFWIPQATPDGKLFYFNTLTGLSTLEIPSENDLHRIPRPIAGPALTGPGPQLSKTGRQLRLEALSKSVRVRRYNIAVVGSSDVSNFAFMIQFFDVDGKSTEEFLPKRCIIDGEAAILKPSNPLGQEDNPATREQCVRNAEGVILLYSVTDRQSLIEVLKFRRQISRLKQTDSVPTILVGDYMESLEKPKVSTHEGQFLANALGLKFREVSILNKTNVEEAFYDVIRHIRSTEEELLLERSRKSWVDELDFANHERDMASDFNV